MRVVAIVVPSRPPSSWLIARPDERRARPRNGSGYSRRHGRASEHHTQRVRAAEARQRPAKGCQRTRWRARQARHKSGRQARQAAVIYLGSSAGQRAYGAAT